MLDVFFVLTESPQTFPAIRLTTGLGISHGAHLPILSILALNVRTEIAYGMFDDGCTALSWRTKDSNFLAQNWDWQQEQKENLIHLRIRQNGKPSIEMITEGGIIGKIGMNSAGVGVCLNAIKAKGVDFEKLPCHLALRVCLDSSSREEAVKKLQKVGVASACHILVADPTGGIGLECSCNDMAMLPMSDKGVVTHTNHFVKEHAGVEDNMHWVDSPPRLKRIDKLIGTIDPQVETIASLLKDEEGFPTSICREHTEDSTVATLFSIVMDLGSGLAKLTTGRPSKPEEHVYFAPALLRSEGET